MAELPGPPSVDIQSFTTLDQVRSHIDTLDHELIRLFNQRMAVAFQLHQSKQSSSNTNNIPLVHTRRSSISNTVNANYTSSNSSNMTQQQLLEYTAQLNKSVSGPCTDIAIDAIYTEIYKASELLQRRTIITLACETGDLLHDITIKYYKSINEANVDIICMGDMNQHSSTTTSLHSTWCSVETGTAQYGVVPLYYNDHDINTLNSNDTITMLSSNMNHIDIYTELLYTAEYYILGHMNQQITTLYVSSNIIHICSEFIKQYLPNVDIIIDESLRNSCINVQHNKSSAVIGGMLASNIYKLDIIQFTADNTSIASERCRALILAPRSGTPSTNGTDKTFLTFAVHDRTGDLHDALAIFKSNHISLTRIESHASRDRVKIWDYVFYAEFTGHCNDVNVKQALVQLESQSRFVKVLGSCPTVNLDHQNIQQ